MRSSLHVVIVDRPGPFVGLAFMAIFIAIPIGFAMALHPLGTPLTAINSFLQHNVHLLTRTCSSLSTLLFNVITFAIRVLLNLFKSIITCLFRVLSAAIRKLAGDFMNKFVDQFKSTVEELITERLISPLRDLFSSATSYLLELLKDQLTKSFESLSSSTKDILDKLYGHLIGKAKGIRGKITSFIYDALGSIASQISDALKDQTAKLLNNAASSIPKFATESWKVFANRIGQLLQKWNSNVKNMQNFVSLCCSGISFLQRVIPDFDSKAVIAVGILMPAWYFEIVRSVWDVVLVRRRIRRLLEVFAFLRRIN